MLTPDMTGSGIQITPAPSPWPSQSVVQTTLVHAIRREDPPAILTNAQTCGYTSGAWSSAVSCGLGSCTYYTTPYSAPNFGCCTEGQSCGYISTCLDYRARGNPNTLGVFLLSDYGFYCGSNSPYCTILLLYGTTYAPGSSYSFFSYGCRTTSAPMIIAFQTTLQDKALATSSTSPPSPSTSTDSLSSTVTETASHITNLPPAGSAPGSTSRTSLRGPQIGIGIGVSIGVGIMLAALAFWLWRLHRKKNDARKYLDQSPRLSASHLRQTQSDRPTHILDDTSLCTNTLGQTGYYRSAPHELDSTTQRHELPSYNL